MTYQSDFDADTFPWWSGACYTVEHIREAGLMDEFQSHIEEMFSCDEEPPTDTDINDYVWHDADRVFEALGLDENGELPEEEEGGDDEEMKSF